MYFSAQNCYSWQFRLYPVYLKQTIKNMASMIRGVLRNIKPFTQNKKIFSDVRKYCQKVTENGKTTRKFTLKII